MKGKNLVLALMSWLLLVPYGYCVYRLNSLSEIYKENHKPKQSQIDLVKANPKLKLSDDAPAQKVAGDSAKAEIDSKPKPAREEKKEDEKPKENDQPWPQLLQVLSVAGGLVSALVISLLAITPPRKAIGSSLVETGESEALIVWSATVYVIAWLVVGSFCLIKGSLLGPITEGNTALKEISSLGITWFGLFVGALYSYFGVQRTDNTLGR